MENGAFDLDQRVRLAAFEFLARQTHLPSDGVPPRSLPACGFSFDGTRVRSVIHGGGSPCVPGGLRVRRGR